MKTALNKITRFTVLLLTLAVCACSQQEAPNAHSAQRESSNENKLNSANYHAVQTTHQLPSIDARGQMADFARIWSGKVAPHERSANAMVEVKPQQRIQDTPEFKRLQGMINAGDFERAKQLADTTELRTAVELEQKMHIEMLKAEQITATLDREKSASKEP